MDERFNKWKTRMTQGAGKQTMILHEKSERIAKNMEKLERNTVRAQIYKERMEQENIKAIIGKMVKNGEYSKGFRRK